MTKKKILSVALAMTLVFGSAAALPENTFTDTAGITASAAKGDVIECDDVDIVNDGAAHGYRVTNFKLMTATSYFLKRIQKSDTWDNPCYAVGENAFAGYKHNLFEIELEQGYRKIEKDAFINSYNLKKYVIPYTVTEIGEHAIGYEYDKKTGKYTKIDGVTIHCDPGSAAEKYANDNGFAIVKTNNQLVFTQNSDGTYNVTGYNYVTPEITIPGTYNGKKVVAIADEAFSNLQYNTETELNNITKITISENIVEIGCGAFWECEGVKTVVLPSSLVEIKEGAFACCRALENAELKKGLKIIGRSAFCSTNLKKLTVPDTVVSIGDEAYQRAAIAELTALPSSLTYIGADVFADTPWLENQFKKSNFAISGGILLGYNKKSNERHIVIPSGVRFICGSTFKICTVISSVTVPSSVKRIGKWAFFACTNMDKIMFAEGLETIDENAFIYCADLGYVKIPSSVKSIGAHAFGYKNEGVDNYIKTYDDFTIYCTKNSAGEKYAKDNDFICEYYSKDPVRLAGAGRYETAAAISKYEFTKADTVVLAYSMSYADALAGVPLANKLNAPILLTNKNSLDKATLAEIKRLGAKKIIILGGEGAIGSGVVKDLTANGIKAENIERIAGKTRYSTATAIAERLDKLNGSESQEVFFVFGGGFADALSISPVAAIKNAPILYLTTDGELNAETAAYIEKLKGKDVKPYVIGGSGVISDNMKSKVSEALGVGVYDVTRLSGSNRYYTCYYVNKEFSSLWGRSVCAATGTDFPDALAGGVLAARHKAPLILVGSSLDKLNEDFLKEKLFYSELVFGGKSAVSDETVKQIFDYRS